MKVREIFERDIARSINGVVKADQLDESSVWQELDEFVVTQELAGHLTELVQLLVDAMESQGVGADSNGIWISGFFGSGKSHFIKVLSYLLENKSHKYQDHEREAVDFFEAKLGDPMLFGDLKRVASVPTDAILFNVDSKADHRKGRDALLQVFLKVLNERQGYSGDHPHIAHLERHLEQTGKLDAFHQAFEQEAGASWVEQRDSWEFYRDQLTSALNKTLGQSEESVEKWIDTGESNFSLTIENFAKWTKQFLDAKGPQHRVIFLVDEVGQFIGGDTHLMLNLQTITEQLGTVCEGRALVAVTSQEDLDKVLGDLKTDKQYDFSKIQGRFRKRLSLSSRNVDEVLKKRLLEKLESAKPALESVYKGKEDILKHQLSFEKARTTFKSYAGTEDFVASYPFAAYQFSLVQKVFESIRKAGATGLHLSQGERSVLDAFQSAANLLVDYEVGVLVPFYNFYPSVEGFLDTSVKRTIEQSNDNSALQSFDTTILKTLFLIRYIDVLPGTVGNLCTLCISKIDEDRIALKREIEDSLNRLESETLIGRNDDEYFFLTNEERDISREIKNTTIQPGEEERELGKLVFNDLLRDMRKHTYSKTGKIFPFNRIVDDVVHGNKQEGNLEVYVVTPLSDRYQEFLEDGNCIFHTSSNTERILIRVPEVDALDKEVRTWLKTEKYVRDKNTGSLPESTQQILRDRSNDNRNRRKRVLEKIEEGFSEAKIFAKGQEVQTTSSKVKDVLTEALEYQIENVYSKMNLIKVFSAYPKQEMQALLRSNDLEQTSLGIGDEFPNSRALDDLRQHIELCTQTSRQIVLYDLIQGRYSDAPYGWPDDETAFLIARLVVLREIELIVDGAELPAEKAYNALTSTREQRRVTIRLKESAPDELIKKAQALGSDLFASTGPKDEEKLSDFLKGKLDEWHTDVLQYNTLASTGKYPGRESLEEQVNCLSRLVKEPNTLRFLKHFVESRDELLEHYEEYQNLSGFYKNQRTLWDRLSDNLRKLEENMFQLSSDTEASAAIERLKTIKNSASPFHLLKEVEPLLRTANGVNDTLIDQARSDADAQISQYLSALKTRIEKANVPDSASDLMSELSRISQRVNNLTSIAHIEQAMRESENALDRGLQALDDLLAKASSSNEAENPSPKKPLETVESKRYSNAIIENQEEATQFLEDLKSAIDEVLARGGRVRIK